MRFPRQLLRGALVSAAAYGSYFCYEARQYRRVTHIPYSYSPLAIQSSSDACEVTVSSSSSPPSRSAAKWVESCTRTGGSGSSGGKPHRMLADTYELQLVLSAEEAKRLKQLSQQQTTTTDGKPATDSSSSVQLESTATNVALSAVLNSLLFRSELLVGAGIFFGGLRETLRRSSLSYLRGQMVQPATEGGGGGEDPKGATSMVFGALTASTAECVGAWSVGRLYRKPLDGGARHSYSTQQEKAPSSSSSSTRSSPSSSLLLTEEGQLVFLPLIEYGTGFEGLSISATLSPPSSPPPHSSTTSTPTTSAAPNLEGSVSASASASASASSLRIDDGGQNTTTVTLRMSYVVSPFDQLERGGAGEGIALWVHDWFCRVMLAQTGSRFRRLLQ